MKKLLLVLASSSLFISCAVVRPGEVGIRQKIGKLSDNIHTQGAVFYNPLTSKVIKTSIQTNDLVLSLNLPSKEGLSVNSEISILYRLESSEYN
jgi:regulator of protease activity HflC (stomatin/prohibitin superfamily)